MTSEFNRRDMLKRLAATSGFVGLGMSGLLTACGDDAKTSATSSSLSSAGASPTGASTGSTAAGESTTTSGSGVTAPSGDPIKIGVLTDITGAFSVVGLSNQAIAQFTIDKINSEGGVLGRPLKMVLVDSATDPAIGAQVARKLVEQDKVAMVIGGIASNMREAIKSVIAARGKTIYIWPASYEGGECTDLVFSTGAAPNQQLDPFIPYLLENAGKSFFLAGADYIYPRNILAKVRQLVEAGGGNVVGEEYYPLDSTDISALQNKVLSSSAEVLFSVVVLPASIPFHKAIVDGGFKGKIAGTLFDETSNVLFGAASTGFLAVQDYFFSVDDPAATAVREAFAVKYPDASFASTFNTPAWYRSLYLWKQAVETAGSIDTDSVAKAMDSASFAGNPGGAASMKPGTHHCSLPIFIGEVQADGSVKELVKAGIIDPTECS
jgi:ABC-type branched-subunit amino acid transport system substrate-binding protein